MSGVTVTEITKEVVRSINGITAVDVEITYNRPASDEFNGWIKVYDYDESREISIIMLCDKRIKLYHGDFCIGEFDGTNRDDYSLMVDRIINPFLVI